MHINKELLYRFFDRTTTFDEEVEIRLWMNASEENRREFFRERKLFDALVLQGYIEKNEIKEQRIVPWKRILVVISGIAAVVLLTVMMTVDYMKQSFQNDALNTIIVPQGQRVNLKLSDGTSVWLNAKTRMEYPQSFLTSEHRVVKIDGEAYFEVTKDPEKPFIVETPKGIVKVLGTKFFVNAYAASEKFETALMEGKVDVHTPNESVILSPNNKAVLMNGKLICQKIEDTDVYRWRDGLYCFKDLTFDEVLKQFEVYYDVRFVKTHIFIDNPRITGKFRLVDGVDYALRVLQREIKFEYRRNEETNEIYLK